MAVGSGRAIMREKQREMSGMSSGQSARSKIVWVAEKRRAGCREVGRSELRVEVSRELCLLCSNAKIVLFFLILYKPPLFSWTLSS